MPFQYNIDPNLSSQYTYQGLASAGQGFSQGISQLGEAWAAKLEKKNAEEKRVSENGRIADAIVKTNPELLKEFGMSQTQFSSQSALDKSTMFTGYMKGLGAREALGALKQQVMKTDQAGIEIDQLKALKQANARIGPRLEENEYFSNLVGPALPSQAPRNPSSILLQEYARAGVGTPQTLGALAEQAGKAGATAGGPNFIEDINGSRFLIHNNVALPSGQNPDKVTTVTVTDPATGQPIKLSLDRSGRPMLKPATPRANPRVAPEFTSTLGQMAAGLEDKKRGREVRIGIKAMLDTAHTLNQITDVQKDSLYKQYGIEASPAPANGALSPEAQAVQAEYMAGPKTPEDREKAAAKLRALGYK